MKKMNFIVLLMLLVTTFAANAGNQFVPKEYSYEEVGSDANKSFYVYFYQLFTYPDEITTKTDISQMEGITITTSSDDNSLIKLSTINAHMSQTRMQLTRVGGAKGETTFSVSITYNGETITNTFPVKVLGLQTSAIKSYVEPSQAEPQIFDVIGNTSFYKSEEKTACTLSLDNADELKHGTAELVDGENGYKVIKYTLNGTPSQIVADAIKYTITLSDGEASSNKVVAYATRNCKATKILEYQPAAGQFRMETAWDNPVEFFESRERGLSLGALGGYVVLGFDQPIYNNPQNPYGVDFTIEGNSFVAAEKGVWTEPGAVQVMEDKNGNGLPDDGEWYELAGSDYWLSTTKRNVEVTYYNPGYNDRYTVPWKMKWEENGETHYEYGAVVTNNFHKHSFYPDYFYNQDNPDASNRWYNPCISRDSLTFTGMTNIRGCIDMRAPTYIEFYNYSGFGYCDNKGFVKEDSRIAQNPYGRPTLGETAGDGMDISWAVDKDGNYVELEKIDFVKVYTAGQVIAGWLGEWSTEVLDCAITLPDPDYVPQDYYYNYAGITQLQVPKGHTCQYEGFLFKNGRPVADATQRWWLSMDKEGEITDGVDAIAEIDNTGFLKANGYGTVWVHFSAMDGIPEEAFEVSVCDLTAVVISLEGNTGPASDELSCIVGERVYINVESEDANTESVNESTANRFIYDNYTWLNSNPEVGAIDNGNFIALKPGVTTLTAVSGINPALNDKITITVLDIPEIEVLSVKVAKNAPKGELLNSDIFSTGNGATVYMDEVTVIGGTITPLALSLYNNHLNYEFTEGEYGSVVLEFKVTCYGKQHTIEVPVKYGPNNIATPKQLLMVNSTDESGVDIGVAQLQGVDVETFETKTYVAELSEVTQNQTLTDNILPDGAYAYLSQGTTLSRYDVAYGNVVAKATLECADKHQLAIYKDKILVSDGNKIKVFYRTDLEAFKTIEMNGTIKHLVVNDDEAYILCVVGEQAMMNKLNLATLALTETNIELEAGNNASGMYYANDKLYIATGEMIGVAASMVVFNPADNTASVVNAILEGNYQVPYSVSALAGNNIVVSRGAGFIAYNIETGTFGDETILMLNEMVIPTLAVGDGERYYVAYSQGIAVFESSDLAQPAKIFNALPSAINLMAATEVNEAPVVKKVYTGGSGIYERTTKAKSCTAVKLSNYFTDTEGSDINNYAMYLREDVDWLEVTYATDGKVTPKATFTGDVDEKTDYVFILECIDKWGASVKTTATFTITPRIYKPTIVEDELPVVSVYGEDTYATRSIADIFNHGSNNNKGAANSTWTFTTSVANVADENMVIVEAKMEEGNLVVTALKETSGLATIELAQEIKHKTYGTKTFSAFVPVVVEYDMTTGVQNVEVSDVCVYYADGNIVVKNCKGQKVGVYDIAGQLIASFTATHDIHTSTLNLIEGVYIVKVGKYSLKISIK